MVQHKKTRKELILKHNINQLSRKKVNELEPLFFDEVIQERLNQMEGGEENVSM